MKRSRFAEIPAWALSLMTLFSLIILGFLLQLFQLFKYNAIEIGFYIFFVLFIPVACFFICRIHPKSVWYTPVICNTVGIILIISYLYANPDQSMLILLGSVLVLSGIGAIVGARIGRRKSIIWSNDEPEVKKSHQV